MARKPYSWRTLYMGMKQPLCERIEAHNRLYPIRPEISQMERNQMTAWGAPRLNETPPLLHRRSYPRRVKDSERDTALNLLKLYCQHVALQINRGRTLIDNSFLANGLTARDGKACPSGTNRHLGKLVHAGILQGFDEWEESARYYKDFEQHEGATGYGCEPYKQLGGPYGSYTLLLAPDLVNVDNLPSNVDFLPRETLWESVPPYLPPLQQAVEAYRIESFSLSQSDRNPSREVIMQKAADSVDNIDPAAYMKALFGVEVPESAVDQSPPAQADPAGLADGNTRKVGSNSAPDNQSVQQKKKNSGGAARSMGVRELFQMIHGDPSQQIAAYAELLMQSYLKKIAALQQREILPTEQERGKKLLVRHLSGFSDPEQLSAMVDRYTLTIDHMRKWLQIKWERGQHAFIPLPSVWFDPDRGSNLYRCEREFLRRFEARGKEFQEADALRNSLRTMGNRMNREQENQLAQQSTLHGLALLVKRYQMKIHPKDHRLKSANIDHWATVFRSLLRKQRIAYKDLEAVVYWYTQSAKSPNVDFWRYKAGVNGLRSAVGISRNFSHMFKQMTLEQVRK